ncbi:Hypothetical predicted protein [Pelobates cultripes]|uniref:Uncharacterized protein n=1 Tax=Pelobates cultripes TaxID=61616 RepID=A0AAD1SHM9_PELCU|nr:Hypothetical predicted protein [Pelobates cultripes]
MAGNTDLSHPSKATSHNKPTFLWKKYAKYFALTGPISPLFPIMHNPEFPAGKWGLQWPHPTLLQYVSLMKVVQNGEIVPMSTLCSNANPTFLDKFQYQ